MKAQVFPQNNDLVHAVEMYITFKSYLILINFALAVQNAQRDKVWKARISKMTLNYI